MFNLRQLHIYSEALYRAMDSMKFRNKYVDKFICHHVSTCQTYQWLPFENSTIIKKVYFNPDAYRKSIKKKA